MRNRLILLLIITSTSIQAQVIKEFIIDVKVDNSQVNKTFYDDGILAKLEWFGSDSKVDSHKTYYASGALNETFYGDHNGQFLSGKQYQCPLFC